MDPVIDVRKPRGVRARSSRGTAERPGEPELVQRNLSDGVNLGAVGDPARLRVESSPGSSSRVSKRPSAISHTPRSGGLDTGDVFGIHAGDGNRLRRRYQRAAVRRTEQVAGARRTGSHVWRSCWRRRVRGGSCLPGPAGRRRFTTPHGRSRLYLTRHHIADDHGQHQAAGPDHVRIQSTDRPE